MRIAIASLLLLAGAAEAFVVVTNLPNTPKKTDLQSAEHHHYHDIVHDEAKATKKTTTTTTTSVATTSRKEFLSNAAATTTAAAGAVVVAIVGGTPESAHATGRATLEQAYRRYSPRIRAGGEFYGGEFKELVKRSDWQGIQAALREVPERTKQDLNRPDAGVAARARQAGAFSDARVLVAADLFASAFSSQNAITSKTKTMKDAVAKLRRTVAEMDAVTKDALGEGGGGFLGFGKKKTSEAELQQKIRTLYAQGGNEWNEYVYAANEELALQFDRFEYVK